MAQGSIDDVVRHRVTWSRSVISVAEQELPSQNKQITDGRGVNCRTVKQWKAGSHHAFLCFIFRS